MTNKIWQVYELNVLGTDFYYMGYTNLDLQLKLMLHKNAPINERLKELRSQGYQFMIRSLNQLQTEEEAERIVEDILDLCAIDHCCLN
jgi:hypothetical protein